MPTSEAESVWAEKLRGHRAREKKSEKASRAQGPTRRRVHVVRRQSMPSHLLLLLLLLLLRSSINLAFARRVAAFRISPLEYMLVTSRLTSSIIPPFSVSGSIRSFGPSLRSASLGPSARFSSSRILRLSHLSSSTTPSRFIPRREFSTDSSVRLANMTWTAPDPTSVGAPAPRVPEDKHTHAEVDQYKPGSKVEYSLGTQRGTLGAPLQIPIPATANKKGDRVHVEIDYATTEHCTALGWLTKQQTAGKTNPFSTRSARPSTAAPSSPASTRPRTRSPTPPPCTRASPCSCPRSRTTTSRARTAPNHFKQPVGIPSYLIAIVGGDLEFRKLGERTGIWAEPPNADAVQWEFEADAERFLEHAEKVISPYSWTRYDSVVLPPSFPYGGMENANLTTLTPSLVCGDRSLTDVLLHELCHSWSGKPHLVRQLDPLLAQRGLDRLSRASAAPGRARCQRGPCPPRLLVHHRIQGAQGCARAVCRQPALPASHLPPSGRRGPGRRL
ncbi:hypothetical protein L1887_59108 [Cichorium endivia]|nr:hypothetical protein L1887_59108 [Cichorium endivia]